MEITTNAPLVGRENSITDGDGSLGPEQRPCCLLLLNSFGFLSNVGCMCLFFLFFCFSVYVHTFGLADLPYMESYQIPVIKIYKPGKREPIGRIDPRCQTLVSLVFNLQSEEDNQADHYCPSSSNINEGHTLKYANYVTMIRVLPTAAAQQCNQRQGTRQNKNAY